MASLVKEHILDLKPYVPGKPIEEVKRELGLTEVLKLASNENALGPSPKAVQALQEAAATVGLYPDGSCSALKQALAAHWNLEPEQIIIGNGSDELIQFIGLTFLAPGDEVIQADPSFVRYEAAAILNQAKCLKVPLRNFTSDLEAMAARLTPRTKLIFVANPNNPTGTMNTRDEVERLLDRVPDHVLVVLDEAYYEYVDDPDYPDSLQYVREGRNVIVLRTFSKIYALAGLRVGYGLARPDLIGYLNQVREPFNVNSLAQVAALASLQDPEQVERARRMNREGKEQLYRAFTELGLPYVPSQANFVLVDVKRDSRQVFAALLRRGVIVRTGDIFGLPTHLRVTVGKPEENERFIAALREVLQEAWGEDHDCHSRP
ncbi:MAG TPA: histidinol-phosphate transaminase [Armatimonadetes bacterium]|nr:histidinol-phosphate transaminase [Armatimonadota bacterium]